MIKQRLWILIPFLLLVLNIQAQDYTISGYIEDAKTGEKLIGANIFDFKSVSGTVSNTYGFYSLSPNGDSAIIQISYIGYTSQSFALKLDKNHQLNIKLEESVALDEIEITADRELLIQERVEMSTIDVSIQQIKKIPALLGEVDVLKAIQLLPGVQSGGEGQSGIFVRGGSADQNLILLDGVPIYNVSHLFGFFSVFNADAIKDVKLIKGGFPARYGGRLSSVLDLTMKEGNNKEFHGEGSIGLVSSKLTLEGPLGSENTSFIVSGRRTYIDILTQPFIKKSFENDGQVGRTGYYFYDLNAKINHRISDKDRIYLSFYGGNDKFYFDSEDINTDIVNKTETGLAWGNITTSLRWNHLLTDKLFSNTTLSFTRYKLSTKAIQGTEFKQQGKEEEFSLEYVSGIDDIAIRTSFDYLPNPNHFIRFGGEFTHHTFKPGNFELGQITLDGEDDFNLNFGQNNIRTSEMALFIEDEMDVIDGLKLNIGLHTSGFAAEDKFYVSLQPRLSARYLLDNGVAVKASFATMTQYIHLLAFEGIGLPTDQWLPTTKNIKPQQSWQAAIGLAKTFGKDYEISIEAYYKKMNNVIAYKEGKGIFGLDNWEERITSGQGTTYGLELFIQKKLGRLSGWIGYTLAWSNRQFDDLNFGNEFPYRYDRRHDISIVASYKISDRINFSATWVYGTGNAVTLANSYYSGDIPVIDKFNYNNYNTIINQYDSRNNYRMKAYHRLDFGFDFTKYKKNWERTWSFGAYNSYNNKNPFFLRIANEYNNNEIKPQLKQISLFPIIPYVAYKFKF